MKEGTGRDRKRAVAVKESARICFRSVPFSLRLSRSLSALYSCVSYRRLQPNTQPIGHS